MAFGEDAVGAAGVAGTVVINVAVDGSLGAPSSPSLLNPVTVKVYKIFDLRPVTIIGEEAPVAVTVVSQADAA